MDSLFSEFVILQYQNKAMRQELEAFRNGERYKKLQADHHKMAAGYIKEINRLKKELAKAHAAIVAVRNIWFEECDSAWEKYQAELNKKEQEILKVFDDRIAAVIKDYEGQLAEKDAVINGLSAKLAYAEALLLRDSTNTSTPTGQTPRGKTNISRTAEEIRGGRKAGSADMGAISWKSLNRKKWMRK